MKKDSINIMLLGLEITIFAMLYYVLKNSNALMSNFAVTINKVHPFNLTLMIGLFIMAFGRFLLWESQDNSNLNEVKLKYMIKMRNHASKLKSGLNHISHLYSINPKVIRFLFSIFNI